MTSLLVKFYDFLTVPMAPELAARMEVLREEIRQDTTRKFLIFLGHNR